MAAASEAASKSRWKVEGVGQAVDGEVAQRLDAIRTRQRGEPEKTTAYVQGG